MLELILLNLSEFKFLGTPFYDADDFWKKNKLKNSKFQIAHLIKLYLKPIKSYLIGIRILK